MKRLLRAGGCVLLALSAAACAEQGPPPPPPGAIPAGQSIGAGEISGRVTFSGIVPPPEVINMSSDAACQARGEGQAREDIVVGSNGALRNVFVHVVSGLGDRVFAPPPAPVVLDQKGCTYRPRVIGVQVDQILELVNSDPTLHNVHAMAAGNKSFNVGLPVQGMKVRRFFERPEVMVRMKCDLHNWMAAYIGVVSHPFYAVTGDDGGFAIKGLPAGEYELEAWHEVFGTQRATVVLGEGESKRIELGFRP
jgi:hypothetical protein